MRVRDINCPPLSVESLGEAMRPMTEESFDAACLRLHLENGLDRAIREAQHLADEASGETRLRILMSVRCLQDAQESFTTEGKD